MQSDKRTFPRFLFSDPVSYSLPNVTVNGSVAGNISLGGISLRVQEFVPIGTIMELQIRLGSSSQILWVKAQVVRVRQVLSEECYEIGLKFIRDEACTRAIGKFLSSYRV